MLRRIEVWRLIDRWWVRRRRLRRALLWHLRWGLQRRLELALHRRHRLLRNVALRDGDSSARVSDLRPGLGRMIVEVVLAQVQACDAAELERELVRTMHTLVFARSVFVLVRFSLVNGLMRCPAEHADGLAVLTEVCDEAGLHPEHLVAVMPRARPRRRRLSSSRARVRAACARARALSGLAVAAELRWRARLTTRHEIRSRPRWACLRRLEPDVPLDATRSAAPEQSTSAVDKGRRRSPDSSTAAQDAQLASRDHSTEMTEQAADTQACAGAT